MSNVEDVAEDQFARAALKATTNEPYLRMLESLKSARVYILSFTEHDNKLMCILARIIVIFMTVFFIPVVIVGAFVKASAKDFIAIVFCCLLIFFLTILKRMLKF